MIYSHLRLKNWDFLGVQHDIEQLLDDDAKLGPHFGGATIIYCQTREVVNNLTTHLRCKIICTSFIAIF